MRFIESARSNLDTAAELLQFFRQNKRWWLLPMVVMLLVFATLIVIAESSAIAPFIYSLF